MDDLLRVQLFKDQYHHLLPTVKCGDEILKVFTKNGDYSAKLRESANRHFANKRNSEALHGYNRAIVYAPIPTETPVEDEDDTSVPHLAFAFGNRSAVLMRLIRFDEAIRDIDLALKFGYPQDSVDKLKCRRQQCEEMLKKMVKNNCDDEVRKYKEENLFKIQSPNPFLPVAQDFVDIQIHPFKGRSLVVTKDVPPGTVLIVEEPFVKNLQKELDLDLKRCHFCFKKIEAGIPCPNCVFGIYCDDICLTSAAIRYHSYECPTLPYLHMNMNTNVYIRMAFRIICTVGPQFLGQIFRTENPHYLELIKGQGHRCWGRDPSTGVYNSDSYLPIYHLASQTEYLTDTQKFNNTLNGIILTEVLDKFTTFFSDGNENENDKENFKDFVASLIIRHLESLACNSMSIGDIELMNRNSNGGNNCSKATEFGGGVYSVCSLMNHSCFPNVTRIHDERKGRMSVVSTMDLKCGQELRTTYGRVFYHYHLQERQTYLKTNFNFDCDCVACVENWPLLDGMVGKSKFCCYCTNSNYNSGPETSKNFSVLDNNGLCSICGKLYDLSKLEKERDYHTTCYHEANELILKNLPLKAIKLLIPCLRFFQASMSWPNITFVLTQDLLKQAMDAIVRG